MFLLAQTLIYVVALAGIVSCTLAGIFFLGGALNRARERAYRVRRGVLAALCFCGVFASAAAGFVGVAAIMYFARS